MLLLLNLVSTSLVAAAGGILVKRFMPTGSKLFFSKLIFACGALFALTVFFMNQFGGLPLPTR